ncbi:hypothetical protein Mzhil_0731 [Methanosalsum zhilinae DSM 4017]|uniref:Uncharacterized protein n=1 Tax=Methanosalsum zhilinae (strain DSM 4017 / NBRC 107636 / OCM 62 / WeN5) TaxID=679901 RepID=F7XKJ4_METZD|nr:hypothetical protein [Methanosalsum zhilinae]AEH60597.1 hypothetical protein Mzhil_0731 [Methanosalsum zhilinae DSM 4017]
MKFDTAEEANVNQFEVLEHVDRGAIYDTHVSKGESFKLIKEKGGDKE